MKFTNRWRMFAVAMALMLFVAACTSPPAPAADVVEPEQPTVSESEAQSQAEPEPETVSNSEEDEQDPVAPVGNAEEKAEVDTSRYDDFEIITLLPPDAIPSIDNPTFHTADEADEFYEPDELVMGVVFNGDARAYSVPHLSSHEIVNDEVGGVKIAVTW